MTAPRPQTRRAGPLAWTVAGSVSLVLLALVFAQLDRRSLAAAAADASWALVGAGVALLLAESLLSAFRTHLIAGRSDGLGAALRVTAWHGVWLLVLPMRLGEVAWVVAMQRAYGWNVATAAACAALQRMLDLGVVAALLLATLPAVLGRGGGLPPALSVLAVSVCLLALLGAAFPHVWLRLAARAVVCTGRPRGRRRRLLRHLSQARSWLRLVRHRRAMRRCLLPTVLVWTAIAAAYWALGRAVGLDLGALEFGFATAGSSLVTALPVQTIGGFGLLEAGFTGIVTGLGAPAGKAALAALTIRSAAVAAAALFWLGTVGLAAARSRRRAAAPAS